ncbi:hypothetical protein ACS0TY_015526 [Phlomoides rotata]
MEKEMERIQLQELKHILLLCADILVSYALFAMQTYLTDVWKLSFTHAAGIINIWGGISKVLPLFFLFFVDTLLGNFKMLVVSSISYTLGMSLLSMSMPPVLGTCKKYEPECIGQTQKVLFYVGMALIAVGMAGYVVSGKNFFREQVKEELTPKTSNGSSSLEFQESFWSVQPFFFLSGWNKYNKSEPAGSPVSDVCRVLVAAALKISQPFPLDINHFYNGDDEGHKRLEFSRFLRCLDKAAIILPDQSVEDQLRSRWKLCSIAQVEVTKFVFLFIPIGATFIVCTIVSSVGNTFLVEQGSHMNRRLGKWKVPSQVLLVIALLSSLCDCFLFSLLRFYFTVLTLMMP